MDETHISSDAKSDRNRRRKASPAMANYNGPSYSDLPRNIFESILLRLSIKRIIICKCVSKAWHNVISDQEFTKLHLNQAQVYPLIQTSGFTALSRMLYLVQPDFEDFELKLDCNYNSPEHNVECGCNVKVKLDTKFRLPLRNLQMIVNGGESNNCLKLNMEDHKYKIINSCNGLLCLSDSSNNEPMVVCNPITGEFIDLPEERPVKEIKKHKISCGFGFSPMTNQYKVIRMSTCRIRHGKCECGGGMVAELHIVGTKSWKILGFFPYSGNMLTCPTYLNGCIWYCGVTYSMIFFDIEKERFGSILPPLADSYKYGILGIGVLGGELCLSGTFLDDHIEIWVMKDRVGEKDWVKVFNIEMDFNERWPPGPYQPIKYLNNGVILMYNYKKSAFVYHNPKKLGFRYLKIRGILKSKVEAISYIPSFVSLKDVVSGSNTRVHNVRSRCGGVKMHKEGKGVSIVEKIRDSENHSDGWFRQVADVEFDSD